MEIKKDSFRGKRCFIVATGPSLANRDLSFLKDEIILSVNLAPLTLDIFGIKPMFNIVADKFHYIRFKEVHKKLTYKKSIKKIIVASACDNFPKELIDQNTFFFPKKLPQEKPLFSDNPLKDGFARGKTVVYDAIQLAYYLGFEEVNIIGMDMNMDRNWGVDGHCYEIQQNKRFSDLSFANTDDYEIQRGHPGNPEYFIFTEECLMLAKKKFEEKGRKIYNDINSSLAVLKKKKLIK